MKGVLMYLVLGVWSVACLRLWSNLTWNWPKSPLHPDARMAIGILITIVWGYVTMAATLILLTVLD